MTPVTIGTSSPTLRRLFTTNADPAAYATLIPLTTNTLDSLTGVLPLASGGVSPNSFGTFVFFGVGSANDTYNCQIVGYRKSQTSGNDEYLPFILADLLCTLGATTSTITTTNKLVKTIAINSSVVVAGYEIVNGNSNIAIARLKLDLEGCQYVRLLPGTATGATKLNGLLGGF